MRVLSLLCSVVLALGAIAAAPGHGGGQGTGGGSGALGPTVFTAPGVFPTSLYKHYYNNPTATSAQPQPIITDPVTVCSSRFLRYRRCTTSHADNRPVVRSISARTDRSAQNSEGEPYAFCVSYDSRN